VPTNNQLILYREIIAVCSETHKKTHKYSLWVERKFMNDKAGGKQTDRWALEG
jgi:hypothetical protein